MKLALRTAVLVGALVILWWVWMTFFPSPSQAVRNTLNKVARLVSTSPEEGNIGRGVDLQRLALLFSDDVQVMLIHAGSDPHTFDGKGELMQAMSIVKSAGTEVKADFLDMRIELGEGNLSALVDLTLRAKIEGQTEIIEQELNVTLKKIKNNWLVTRVETVSPLKP